jgi:putative tricarboxylic transport membrane protein
MNLRDQLSGLFWLGVSVFICVESIRSRVGSFRAPGPGFFPLCSGIILGAFAVILILLSILRKKEDGKAKSLWKGINWSKIVLVLGSLFVYTLLLPEIGYLVTTFGLLTLLFSIIGRPRLWLNGMMAFITVLGTYLLFHIWLDVQLPKGIFGF